MSTELQQLNGQNKAVLWAERISECRNSGLSVKTWCRGKGICEATYYKWQKKIFAMAQAQQEPRFAEVTPMMAAKRDSQIAISIQAGGVEASIHNGADPATMENEKKTTTPVAARKALSSCMNTNRAARQLMRKSS